MAILPQPSLFSWENVDASPEILRLQRVLDVLPDSELLAALEAERKGRRDDYPFAALWNSLIAGVVFGHESMASLIRELRRNGELRQVCGFDPLDGVEAVPRDWIYSRFLKKLIAHRDKVEAMFDRLVDRVRVLVPDYGANLAIDGKALPTHGHADPDADTGIKTYKGVTKDGTPYEQVKSWFGYRLHLIVDADYELPVAYELTKASEAESPKLLPMVERIEEDHPELYARIETLSGDKGYDDGQDKADLYDEHDIAPLIDTRDLHSGKPAGAMRPLRADCHDTIYYGPTGEVCCKVNPFAAQTDDQYAAMQFMGFEKDRLCLKFRCPAAAYGVDCRNRQACKCQPIVRDGNYGRAVRVPLETDRRIFLPIHRHSRGFYQAYKKRSAVERVNGRIDQVYGFEHHFIRGLNKMKLRIDLAMVVMLATAVAWIEVGKIENARSLFKAA